jgi:hypothetical protein
VNELLRMLNRYYTDYTYSNVLKSLIFVNRYPDCITIDDVRTAILARPEFDLFSNNGLGVQVTDTG